MRFEPLGQKMFSRRNWLLRCSILINIAVILYIGSHVMIGGGNNFTTGSTFVLQEQQTNQIGRDLRESLSKNVSKIIEINSIKIFIEIFNRRL